MNSLFTPKYKVCVCGSIRDGLPTTSGQTIKTRNLISELDNQYGEERVCKIDTQKGVINLFGSLFKNAPLSRNIIILPAQNGIRVLAPVLFLLNLFLRRNIQYSVIGAWLPTFLKNKPVLRSILKKYDAIYVETKTLQSGLVQQGFQNVVLMPNFKRVEIVKEESMCSQYQAPFRLCTFSRVMKEKGIEDAVNVITEINNDSGREVFTLDIYGKVEEGEESWFEELENSFPSCIKYKGVVDSTKSTSVLKDYFCLLFPTLFYTEGIPGTIIDAYAAGVPVIASRWQSFDDVVDDGISGLGYEFGNRDALKQLIIKTSHQPEIVVNMKSNCLKMAMRYSPEDVMKKLMLK